MKQVTIAFGIYLVLLGLIAYVPTGMHSPTALIPTIFGVLFIILGTLSAKEYIRTHVMHGSVALGILGIFPTIGAIPQLFGDVVTVGIVSRAMMSIGCIVYVAIAFIYFRSD